MRKLGCVVATLVNRVCQIIYFLKINYQKIHTTTKKLFRIKNTMSVRKNALQVIIYLWPWLSEGNIEGPHGEIRQFWTLCLVPNLICLLFPRVIIYIGKPIRSSSKLELQTSIWPNIKLV